MAWTQIDRPFRLKSTLGDDALLLESFEGQERVSAPFRYVLRVLTEDPDVDILGLLKTPLVLTIKQSKGTSERHIHGNISRMKLLNTGEDGMAAYEIEMVPSFWFLNLFSDCRIFNAPNQTVPAIVEQVFKARGITNYRLNLQGSYPAVEYCVQYRETDFNFVSRLLEREGIFYYFEQSADDHTMVLLDKKESSAASPHNSSVKFAASTGGVFENDSVFSLEAEVHVYPGTASLRDYDFTKPGTDLSGSLSGSVEGEVYDYPGQYLTKDDGDRYSRVRLEEHEAQTNVVRAESNCMGLECGYKFTLQEHYRAAANQEYFVTSLWQFGENASYRSGESADAFQYRNRFDAIPSSVAFRPPRLARQPVIDGAQTAVVVGKSGEEIWTDQYGRVRVQFYWDRQGKCDENSSCWIRVSHNQAGKNWGAISLPRIGQEVIVSFLEGDPDRPIITGRVYNADQMPPYTLPDEQTKSTIKSMSSKGGGGFNEFRFEDKKGSEQIFLHGEKDLDLRVKNDRKETIGHDRSLEVLNDKFEKITGNEHSQIGKDRNEKVTGDHSLAVTGNQGIEITGNHSLKVTGNVAEQITGTYSNQVTQTVYIKGQQVVIEAEQGLTINVGGNFVTIDSTGVSIKGTMVNINSGGAALPGSAGTLVTLKAPADPTDADDNQPGGTTSAPSPADVNPKTIALTKLSPASPQQAEAEEEAQDIPVPASAASSAASRAADPATFGADTDVDAQAAALKAAAADGKPFCPE